MIFSFITVYSKILCLFSELIKKNLVTGVAIVLAMDIKKRGQVWGLPLLATVRLGNNPAPNLTQVNYNTNTNYNNLNNNVSFFINFDVY